MISRAFLLKLLALSVLLVSFVVALEDINKASADVQKTSDDDVNSLFGSTDEDEDLEESGRVAFVTVDNNGIVVTFNATSLLLGALAALAVGAVAAAIAIPLAVVLGLKKKYYDYDYDYSGYSNSNSGGYGDSGHGGGSSYTAYAKRSLEVMSPVMKALYSAYQKYSSEDENTVKL